MVVSRLLRIALIADAVATAATGFLLVSFASGLESLLNISGTLQRYAGLGLLPYALVVAYLGSRLWLSPAAVWAVIAGNVLWAIDSILLLFTGWIAPTPLGSAFVITQAVIVALFAQMQYVGLRRSPVMPAGAVTAEIRG